MTQLASQTEISVQVLEQGLELKWCLFTKGSRGSIGKIVVDARRPESQTAHVVAVSVKSEYRGRKLGEELVRMAQKSLRENGFRWLTLEAEENTSMHGRLVALYERCGFSVWPPEPKITFEYNGDECFRKVPMRCDLFEMRFDDSVGAQSPSVVLGNVTTTATTTTSSSSRKVESDVPFERRYVQPDFVQALRREALELVQVSPQNLDLISATQWLDTVNPGTLERALRTGWLMRNRGHPDWFELAGYLRDIGEVQRRWTGWKTPLQLNIGTLGRDELPVRQASSSGSSTSGEEEETNDHEDLSVKCGPLPKELVESHSTSFVDADHYAPGMSVDEATLSWTSSEFAFLSLTSFGRCSAPKEMASVLRYRYCDAWLESDQFAYIEAWGDRDLKDLCIRYRRILNEADATAPPLNTKQTEEAFARMNTLVWKYAADVRVM